MWPGQEVISSKWCLVKEVKKEGREHKFNLLWPHFMRKLKWKNKRQFSVIKQQKSVTFTSHLVTSEQVLYSSRATNSFGAQLHESRTLKLPASGWWAPFNVDKWSGSSMSTDKTWNWEWIWGLSIWLCQEAENVCVSVINNLWNF